jgi:polyribonucleotide nucleotidyltransferase
VTAAKSVKDGQDFFRSPSIIQEKYSAAGRIPKQLLQARTRRPKNSGQRLIDTAIRPLFPEGFYNEVLLSTQVLS